MNTSMKVLLAYDGSAAANIALVNLIRIGLPLKTSFLVVTVCEVSPPEPPLSGEEATETVLASGRVSTALARAYQRALKARSDAYLLALGGSERARTFDPTWTVAAEVLSGSPASEIIRRAEERQADLIVVGSEGHSTLGRLVFGSVSLKVAAYAKGSVHVGRSVDENGDGVAPRIIIGVDGSAGAERAVRAVSARTWASGAKVRVVTVDEGQVKAYTMAESAQEELRSAGLVASREIKEGDPLHALIEEARAWGTHCIFVGSRGLSGMNEASGLGRVSAGLVTGAHCSVEVVR